MTSMRAFSSVGVSTRSLPSIITVKSCLKPTKTHKKQERNIFSTSTPDHPSVPQHQHNNNNNNNINTPSNIPKLRAVSTLILLRHGQSQWNGPDSRFTGWVDVPLTVRGRVEAVAAGQLLRSRGFHARHVDVAFTSRLQRASETCELALASMAGPDQHTWSGQRIRRDLRLNERHYGVVQGRRKNDEEVLRVYGVDTVRRWRRSMKARPPPLDATHPHYKPYPAPLTESLEDCQERVLDAFHDAIAPALFDEENLPTPADRRTVIVVAHSNTIRSLMAAFDDVPIELVPKLHVPNSVPILYRFDQRSRQPVSSKLQSAAGGSHARWLISKENHRSVRDALEPGGVLTRSLFEAINPQRKGALTTAEIDMGLRELLKDGWGGTGEMDCVVTAIAKKIAREVTSGSGQEAMTLEEFERRATEVYEGLQNPDGGVEEETFASFASYW